MMIKIWSWEEYKERFRYMDYLFYRGEDEYRYYCRHTIILVKEDLCKQ